MAHSPPHVANPVQTFTEATHEEPVRILLVDDNPGNLLALQAVLEPLGQELVLAHSGPEALERLNEEEVALVLMDVHMPVLDGFQTVEAIRQRKRLAHLPVMFLTAIFRNHEAVARGYALGAVDFITKPFEPEFIRAKVGAFVLLYQHNERLKRHEHLLAEEIAARRTAEHSARIKEEFIAVLGHDLRTPLQVIILAAEKHERIPEVIQPCREVSQQTLLSANRMARLIDDVVDFTRSRLGGGIPIQPKYVDMAELCRVPLDELQAIHASSTLSVQVEGDVRGRWDPDRVLQVIANLLGNAVLHGDGVVEVALRGAGDVVTLEVHNGGLPILADKMEHLFEPFFPGGRRREGLGLGLYIVDQIVRAHGGRIDVESSETMGTTFRVYWPRGVSTAAAP